MHKQGPESGPAMWASELREFFDWLLDQMRAANQPPFTGNKNTRRQIKRAIQSCRQRLVKAYPLAPGLQFPIAACLKSMRYLYDMTDDLLRALSVDWDRRAKERAKERLCVAWVIAPVISTGNRYDSIKEHLAAKDNCQTSSIDERVRRFRQELDYRGFKLAWLVETYFKEFKLATFWRHFLTKRIGKSHTQKSLPRVGMSESLVSRGRPGYERITAETYFKEYELAKFLDEAFRKKRTQKSLPLAEVGTSESPPLRAC